MSKILKECSVVPFGHLAHALQLLSIVAGSVYRWDILDREIQGHTHDSNGT